MFAKLKVRSGALEEDGETKGKEVIKQKDSCFEALSSPPERFWTANTHS